MKIYNIKYTVFHILILTLALFSSIYANTTSCIATNHRDIYRNNFTFPEQIQSEHFIIHFTTSDVDSQLVNNQWLNLQSNYGFAQSIIDLTEIAYSIYIQKGWEAPPPDCDEAITDINSEDHCMNFGGNSLYDIYIANDAVGMVVPETSFNVPPYTGGYTSYMKVSTMLNEFTSLPYWAIHVVAHELHHSIQLRYGYSTSGTPGSYIHNSWFFEQSASYMENMIFPDANHLQLMLTNCSVVTPLTYPHYGIDYPAEIYPYRSALWQKFLVESLGDSSIVRLLWEDYGNQYATGAPVSLFPIYSNAIDSVTNNEIDISEAYRNYGLWRYFTGDRSISESYFNEADNYCTSSIISDFEGTFQIGSNKGGAFFIDLPLEEVDLIFSTPDPSLLQLTHLIVNDNNIQTNALELVNENTYLSLNGSEAENNALIITSIFSEALFSNIPFTISINESVLLGDVNFDYEINILDIVIIVNFSLLIESPNTMEFEAADINNDDTINILDVVQLINLILM